MDLFSLLALPIRQFTHLHIFKHGIRNDIICWFVELLLLSIPLHFLFHLLDLTLSPKTLEVPLSNFHFRIYPCCLRFFKVTETDSYDSSLSSFSSGSLTILGQPLYFFLPPYTETIHTPWSPPAANKMVPILPFKFPSKSHFYTTPSFCLCCIHHDYLTEACFFTAQRLSIFRICDQDFSLLSLNRPALLECIFRSTSYHNEVV